MSRAHAVAPAGGAETQLQDSEVLPRRSAARPVRRSIKPATSCYLERALLLWPRLDRARVRKVADDPARIAEIVERRTSQPRDVILAMLTRQSAAFSTPLVEAFEVERGRIDSSRRGLRIVRSQDGATIQVQDLRPA